MIHFGEYMRCMEALKSYSQEPGRPEYLSAGKLLDDRHRHKRSEADPQQSLKKPLTGNLEYGWQAKAVQGPPRSGPCSASHCLPPGIRSDPDTPPHRRIYYGLHSTDVTQREGRSLQDFYGM